MTDEEKTRRRLEQVRELLRDAENEQMPVEPDFLTKYAGQWVVLDHGRVVAHGKDGAEVAMAANVEKYPGSEILYVPTLEKQAGVRITSITLG